QLKMSFVNIDLKELAKCLTLKDTFELLRIICEKDNKYELDSLNESSSSTDSVYDQTPS
ncbi:15515_t:CDS:1, partial [Cetraspora pellucida]